MKDTRLVIRCQDHPTYRGLRMPRVDCEECRIVHRLRGATTKIGFYCDGRDMPDEHYSIRVGSA